MQRLLVFVGESGSGKTTIITELVRRHPDKFKKVVTCTSRPARVGEIDGIDYHFLPAEHFLENHDLVLIKKTDDGNYYGTRIADLRSNTHFLLIALRLAGVNKLVDLGFKNVTIVHILINEELKIDRMRRRGDIEEMILSRLQLDATDRINVDLGQILSINLDATQTLDEKVECILRAC